MSLRVPLWDAINRYAQACGGDTGATNAHGNMARMNAVVEVERIVDLEIRAFALALTVDVAENPGEPIAKRADVVLRSR